MLQTSVGFFLILTYSLLNAAEYDNSYVNILELKCLSAPLVSHFEPQTLSCYYRVKGSCSLLSGYPNLAPLRTNPTSDLMTRLLQSGVFKKGENLNNAVDSVCIQKTPASCDGKFQQKGEFCYQITEKDATYQQSITDCKQKKSSMFVPNNNQEIQNVLAIARNDNLKLESGAYIGISYNSTIGQWTSTSSNVDYLSWMPSPFEVKNVDSDDGDNKCKQGWRYCQATDACYRVFVETTILRHSDAEVECWKQGGEMASAKTADEIDFLINISRPIIPSSPSPKYPYIGLRRSVKNVNEWRWTEDQTIAENIFWDRTTEPSNGASELCAILSPFSPEKGRQVLSDGGCFNYQSYICKIPATKKTVKKPKTCNDGWTVSNNACYKLFIETANLPYSEAEFKCWQNGARMTSIRKDEVPILRNIIKSATTATMVGIQRSSRYWSQWMWNYNRQVATDVPWYKGEPSTADETCAVILPDGNNDVRLLDTPCLYINQACYICKIELEDKTKKDDEENKEVVEIKTTNKQCPNSWAYSEQLKACYQVFVEPSNVIIQNAEIKCNQYDGHLTSAKNQDEMKFIQNVAKAASAQKPYIGLRRSSKFLNGWRWFEDGSLADNDVIQFWGVNSDNTQAPSSNGTCAYISPYASGLRVLFDTACSKQTNSYICKISLEEKIVRPTKCRTGWSYLSSTNGCYRHFTDDKILDIYDAEFRCLEEGAHVAPVATQEELGIVRDLVVKGGNDTWIGMWRPSSDINNWRYIENGKMATSILWMNTEPNNTPPELCSFMFATRDFKGGRIGICDSACDPCFKSYVCKYTLASKGNGAGGDGDGGNEDNGSNQGSSGGSSSGLMVSTLLLNQEDKIQGSLATYQVVVNGNEKHRAVCQASIQNDYSS